jgi:hypothetical protein
MDRDPGQDSAPSRTLYPGPRTGRCTLDIPAEGSERLNHSWHLIETMTAPATCTDSSNLRRR